MISGNIVLVGFDVGIKNFAYACEWLNPIGERQVITKKTTINNTNELGAFLDMKFLNEPFLKNKAVFIGFEDNHWMKAGAYKMWKVLNEYNGFIKGMFYGDTKFTLVSLDNHAVKNLAKTMNAPSPHEKDALAIIKLMKEKL